MKRALIMSIVLSLLLSSIVFASPKVSDISRHWAKESIENLITKGIIAGYPDGTFKPNNNVSRAEAIKLLVLAATGRDLSTSNDDHWATNYINDAIDRGYVLKSEFDDYNKAMSRVELARIIVRALEEKYPDNISDYSKQLKDYSNINNSDKDYVLKAYVKGIITGYPDGTFIPSNNVTRAEAATMLVRFLEPEKRVLPELKNNNGTVVDSDFVPKIDREKIIAELKKYPTDNKDIEEYPEYSDITFCNSIFIKHWERDAKIIHDQTIDFINVLFNRDYENLSKTYKDELIVYFKSWLLYNGIDNLTPDDFVNMWIKETKEYKIKQEAIFVTDLSLGYISNEGVRQRGRLFFRYLNHEKPDNIRFELEKEDESFKVGKWYSVDVDIEWWRPFSNVPYTHKPKSNVLYSYSNYLNDFTLIEK